MQYSKEEEAPPSEVELPELNEKQMRFVSGLADGLSASEAYRRAYGCEGWTNESVWSAAYRLKKHPGVQAWLGMRRVDLVKKIGYAREQAIQDLEDIKHRALAEGKYIAAINATQLQCKIEGHVGESKPDEKTGKSDSLLAQIEKQFGPEMARAAAKKLGLETGTVH